MTLNETQEAKALGLLIGVELKDLDRASVVKPVLPADRTCGHPEAGDQELADADPGALARALDTDEQHAEAIRMCHLAMTDSAAAGAGGWGHCVSTLYPEHHAVRYYCDRDSFPAHYHRKVTNDEILELSSERSPWFGWARDEAFDRFNNKSVLDVCLLVGVEETFRLAGVVHVETQNHDESGIHIRSRVIQGPTIGIGWFPNPGCGSHVEFHIDSSWNVGLQPRIGLFGHECGHCNRLPHTFNNQDRHKGVMSYRSKFPYEGFSTGEDPHTLPRDPSWAQLRRQYDPRPAPELNAPTPPTPPAGDAPTEEEFDAFQTAILAEFAEFRRKHYGGDGRPPLVWS